MKKPARVFPAPGDLAVLVERPGGLPRGLAIIQGQRHLDEQRAPALAMIGGLIETLEDQAARQPAPAHLPEMRRTTDRVIALAALYGLDALAEAGRMLCDLLLALEARQTVHGKAIAVHVRALRLLGADASDAARILGGLGRVQSHLGPGGEKTQ